MNDLQIDTPTASLPAELLFKPGIPGFLWADLHDPQRLRDLAELFYTGVAEQDPALWERFDAYRKGAELPTVETSRLLVQMGPHLSAFVARLFGVENERARHAALIGHEKVIARFKNDFVTRRVLKRAATPVDPDARRLRLVALLWADVSTGSDDEDQEHATASFVDVFLRLDKEYKQRSSSRDPKPVPAESRAQVAHLRRHIQAHADIAAYVDGEVLPPPVEAVDEEQLEHDFVQAMLGQLELWLVERYQDPAQHAMLKGWVSFHTPHPTHYDHLVEVVRPDPELPEMFVGPDALRRRRDGFKLTDLRMDRRRIMDQVDYCLFCHERDKDSCSKGFAEKTGGFKKNPLGIPLAGCPLDEKISEMHLLKSQGDPLAALAMATIDNPMLAGTGHRICNDCMKACIFQKQEPVNIPEIETSVLTDILNLPWGFEIWSLLTRWNPLNIRRPYALPYNGKNVLVVGLGPAGYTLAHYLINEGFGVVGIDGLKIEPLPEALVGSETRPPRPVRNIKELFVDLDRRVLAGFGGVSEYGITVRWDKNFLTALYLNLARRKTGRFYGGVRFGGTITIEEAWATGFDHIAIATGAGKPTVIDMKNNLIRGIRKASDFLMALQLTGAFKRDNLTNLQMELPAIVIGGGLTAIDTSTEAVAYYVVQVEKALERYEALEAAFGRQKVEAMYDSEEMRVLQTFLEHGRAVREERARAAAAGELPDFPRLVDAWGGVSLVYRKSMHDSPAYRLNHEEVAKSLEEGIRYIEKMNPVEAIPDEHGAVSAVKFERQEEVDGKWRATGEFVTLPARSVFVAAGTSPNIIPEKERPGLFQLDSRGQFFQGHRAVRNEQGQLELVPVGRGEVGFFTSYRHDAAGAATPNLITFYGDNHPIYAGNVVKAMASAKYGYPRVAEVFAQELAQLEPEKEAERLPRWTQLVKRLEDELIATVVRIDRLTPTIVEVIVRAPLASRHFEPGQFYRLQNYEVYSPEVAGTRLMMEGLALTGAWVDKEQGLLSLIVLEMGSSSRLCAALSPGERVVVMGPTGYPTEIPENETVLLAGGGLGNAVLFSIARALKDRGCKVIYFAGYRNGGDVFKREEIEAATDVVVWSWDSGTPIPPGRPQDLAFHGNIVQAMKAYEEGRLGATPIRLCQVDRIVAIGSDRMMAAVKAARRGVLHGFFKENHEAIGSINSPMQCMMKEVCAQCLQKHIDPVTGKETVVFTCFNQDQKLDFVDFTNLNQRLRTNTVQEKLSNLWLDYVLERRQLTLQ